MLLSDEDIKKLNDADRMSAVEHFYEITHRSEYRHMDYKEILDYLKAGGFLLFKSSESRWGEVRQIRNSQLDMLSMILYDYDGFSMAHKLKKLVIEVVENIWKGLIGYPEILYGGGGDEFSLSLSEKEHGVKGYSLPLSGIGDCSFCRIPYDEYGNETDKDVNGLINDIRFHEVATADYWKLVVEYKEKCSEVRNNEKLKPSDSEISKAAEGKSIYRTVEDDKRISDDSENPNEVDIHLMKTYVEIINICYDALLTDSNSPEFWMKTIDDIVDTIGDFWKEYHRLSPL